MKTELNHLPPAKRRELEFVVQLIFEEFTDALALAQQSWKKQGRILKIILFGSHARGGWVDEPHTAKGYLSDFDLLVIVNHDRLTDRASYWTKADERLIRERTVVGTLRTPVNFIVHTLGEVNSAIAEGRYFFTDIGRDGIAIYQSDDSDLATPKPKSAGEALELTREYEEEWLTSGREFYDGFVDAAKRENLKKAVFDLHQAAERFLHGLLLCLTLYSPHTHRLSVLRSIAESLDDRLISVWPRETRSDRAKFEKLNDAYIKARYSKHYQISADELAWLGEHVEKLGQIVTDLCAERIAKLEAEAGDTGTRK